MKRTPVSTALGISYPVLQAGLPWVSNPELVAAVSNAGGLGVLHPTTGNEPGGDPVSDLHGVIRRVQRLTTKPFGVSFHLPHPQIEQLIEASAQEGITIAITYGGSPALYTGKLKEHSMTIIHQIATVRQARGAEAQGVDMVIAEGFEGGGLRGADKVSTMVLVPQVVGSIAIPVIASGGIVDSRGYVAATALGAMGVQMGSRFVATKECISHQIYKTAMIAAIDSGTIVVGGDKWPTRILKQGIAMQMRESSLDSGDDSAAWEQELGIERTRAAFLDGDFDSGIAYTGAGAGLISEILTVQEVFKDLVDGSHSLARKLV
ncbi:MAG: nitronate monooxygenase [Dehalococcoidia bacterium]|nr:nitronate monooxygenase [Dehalococcoidia bacterium]|tara:strand:+ start:724 stop:1683 length:960 start_codon:yes stop_codon:yes gene_type:complete